MTGIHESVVPAAKENAESELCIDPAAGVGVGVATGRREWVLVRAAPKGGGRRIRTGRSVGLAARLA